LDELQKKPGPVPRKLSPDSAQQQPLERLTLDEKRFRWQHNEDQMATEKLSEGIRLFTQDALKLEQFLAPKLA
jgi:transaldolase